MKSGRAKERSTARAAGKTKAAREGANGRNVQFVYAGPAKAVTVAGDFNGWDLASDPLNCCEDGLWSGIVTLAPGRYEYQFVVDGAFVLDERCPETAENPFGTRNNVLSVA